MSAEYSYSEITTAKDGNKIPLCKDSSTAQKISLHSKYNPIREAEAFAANIDTNCLFFVILGLAGGYHVKKIIEKCPEAKILAVETSKPSIDFLMGIPVVKELSKNKNIHITDIEHLGEKLLALYKPAIHGNLMLLSLRQWETIFPKEADICRSKINQTIKLLAADYSVQSHFGKIWQKNIISNLSVAEKTKSFQDVKKDIALQTHKTAAIIAAGPSLDENIKRLRSNRNAYFIIATDTAFSSLTKQGIQSDAVVSIDGQMISHQHYMEQIPKSTLYVFDLCASSPAVRKVLGTTDNVIFAETGHPLAQYASMFTGKRNFMHLEAGSGTVTIAAANLANTLGFSKIEFFGADFSYIDGRPYCRGTYLETQFHSKSTKFDTAEKLYSAIMYRTPVIKISENKITTEILNAYKDSLADFMKHRNKNIQDELQPGRFDFKNFKLTYCNDLRNAFKSEDNIDEASFAFTTLLPLCAKIGKGSAFLAYLKTLRYTERI